MKGKPHGERSVPNRDEGHWTRSKVIKEMKVGTHK